MDVTSKIWNRTEGFIEDVRSIVRFAIYCSGSTRSRWKKYPAIDYKSDRKMSRPVMPKAVKGGPVRASWTL